MLMKFQIIKIIILEAIIFDGINFLILQVKVLTQYAPHPVQQVFAAKQQKNLKDLPLKKFDFMILLKL